MSRLHPLALIALVAACRTAPLDGDSDGSNGDGGNLLVFDLAVTVADLAGGCLPQNRDAGSGNCPCGAAGLCRPATGRLAFEAQSGGGQLRVVVMDDNGCNRHDVALDQPLGTPRWAPDHERLAYVTAGSQRGTLHVLRVDAGGQVVCHERINIGSDIEATSVAWAGDDSLWLFSPRNRALTRLDLAGGAQPALPFDMLHFDTHLDGRLVAVEMCIDPSCVTRVVTRPMAAAGPLTTLRDELRLIGPVRLSQSGDRTVYELDGFVVVPPGDKHGPAGARSPAFALADQAIVYTTDDGQLRYQMLSGPQEGMDLTLPSTWRNAYSPDWAPPPAECQTITTCR